MEKPEQWWHIAQARCTKALQTAYETYAALNGGVGLNGKL
jgi:hypothetical protein